MPDSTRTPSYRRHKPSGQAVVSLNGKDFYLGPWKSKASRIEYDRLTGEWLANNRILPIEGGVELTVAELVAAFWRHAKVYYVNPDGSPAQEQDNYRYALRPLNRLYADTPVAKFGPLSLKTVRNEMLKPQQMKDEATGETIERPGWCRNVVNRQVGRIKAVFRWGVAEQLVPPTVMEGLRALDGLRKGRSEARETAKVTAVPEATVRATLPFLSAPLRTVAQLQLLTGTRSGELLALRGCDIDMSRPVWLYKPPLHKNAFKDLPREIFFGPKAQSLLRPFLKPNPQAHLFSPADAVAEMRENRRSQAKRPARSGYGAGERALKAKPKRKPGKRYDSRAYAHAIRRAAEKAGLPHWHPHQIRHTSGTHFRTAYGFEAANILLGHESDEATGIYAEKDRKVAERIMGEVG